ncbi:COG3400 family protein [Campylobacter troglodytis]|uniref:COG3400 family protein n=1 Tax=Campylobacter troglodytis TaxID=654363 RepID=UPI00115B9C4A|nr:TrkA C-terminal domain-containing protein [Campylobacter troglodytis]TQR56911.1 potassium transporter TrkA [Campylobacter troglodytis]
MNILLILDGILAKYFLERLCLQKALKNFFVILYYNDETVGALSKSEGIEFVKFDPTSLVKLEHLCLIKGFNQIFIFMQDEFDSKTVYENIRSFNESVDLVMMDFWGLSLSDKHLELIDARAILSNQLSNFMPNVAITAQLIGLGIGEIIEVKIPADSIFAYRHIGTIEQRKWKIALVYRNSKPILARDSTLLKPNDSLLLVGTPSVLQTVSVAIQEQSGQFPNPFGSNILTLLDMKQMSLNELELAFNLSLTLQAKTNSKKLFIRVLNPTINEFYQKLRAFEEEGVSIHFDHLSSKLKNSFEGFVEGKDIGMLIINDQAFEKNKKQLFALKIPILKLAKEDFKELKSALTLSSNEFELEGVANVMIDLGKQLNLEVEIHHYEPDAKSEEVEEHLKNLSKLYSKNIKIINEKHKNPLLELQNRRDLLHFVQFSEQICEPHFIKAFSTDLNSLYYKMRKNYQLFIPTN